MDNASLSSATSEPSSSHHQRSSPSLNRRSTPPRRPISFELPVPSIHLSGPSGSTDAATPLSGGALSGQHAASTQPVQPKSKRSRHSAELQFPPVPRNNRNSGGTPTLLNPHGMRQHRVSFSSTKGKGRAEEDVGDDREQPLDRDVSGSPTNGPTRPAAGAPSTKVPYYDPGMDIFNDSRGSDPILEAQIAALQRKARELGPAPLDIPTQSSIPGLAHSPTRHFPLKPPIPSTNTDIGGPSSPQKSPTSPATSSLTTPTLNSGGSPFASPTPSPDKDSGKTKERNKHSHSRSLSKTHKHGRSASLMSHLLSDLRSKGKGKLKDLEEDDEDEADEAQGVQEAEQRILAIRNSLATTSLQRQQLLDSRLDLAKTQLERRYGRIYEALEQGLDPPNPIQILKWRKKTLDLEKRRRAAAKAAVIGLGKAKATPEGPLQGNTTWLQTSENPGLPFDAEEMADLPWVKKEWLLTASLTDGYVDARQTDWNNSTSNLKHNQRTVSAPYDSLGRTSGMTFAHNEEAPLQRISSTSSSAAKKRERGHFSLRSVSSPFSGSSLNMLIRRSMDTNDGRSVSGSSGGQVVPGKVEASAMTSAITSVGLGLAIVGVGTSGSALQLTVDEAREAPPSSNSSMEHTRPVTPPPEANANSSQKSIEMPSEGVIPSQDDRPQQLPSDQEQLEQEKRRNRISLPGIFDGVAVSLPGLLDSAKMRRRNAEEQHRPYESTSNLNSIINPNFTSTQAGRSLSPPHPSQRRQMLGRTRLAPNLVLSDEGDIASGYSSFSEGATGGHSHAASQRPSSVVNSEYEDNSTGVTGLLGKVKSEVKSLVSITSPGVPGRGKSETSQNSKPPLTESEVMSTSEDDYGYPYSGKESAPTDSAVSGWRTRTRPEGTLSPPSLSVSPSALATRAGRRVAKGWTALTSASNRRGNRVEDGRSQQSSRTGFESVEEGDEHHLQVNPNVRGGTRSDNRLRAFQARPAAERFALQSRLRPLSAELEEERRARRRGEEYRYREMYERRSNLVTTSKRQSEALSHVLQLALGAISEYAQTQNPPRSNLISPISAPRPSIPSLLAKTQDPLDPNMLELLLPVSPSRSKGWRAVEEDCARRELLRRKLDPYLISLGDLEYGPLALKPLAREEENARTGLTQLVRTVDMQWTHVSDGMKALRELQALAYTAMDKAEILYNQTAERVDTTYPELARNAELLLQLSPEYSAGQILPDWVPQWAQDLLRFLSPHVQRLADATLNLWRIINIIIVWMPDWSKAIIGWLFQAIFLSIWLTCRTAYNIMVWILQMAPMKFTWSLIVDAISGWRTLPATRIWAAAAVVLGVLVVQYLFFSYARQPSSLAGVEVMSALQPVDNSPFVAFSPPSLHASNSMDPNHVPLSLSPPLS